MGGAGRIAGGVICLAIGWAGFEMLGWMVVRRRDLGYDILTGDALVLGLLSFIGVLATLILAQGLILARRGMRAWRQGRAEARAAAAGTPAPVPARDVEWLRRRIVFGTPVRGGMVVLAWIFFGGPALLFLIVPLAKDPTLAFAALPLSAVLLLIVGAATYWWLRWRRYGDSVCWLRTLPGVAGGRFEADVDCSLPEGPEPVIIRLRNYIPMGKRSVEVWRMEESVTVPAKPGRTVVGVRLSVPRANEQRFAPLQPGWKEWFHGMPAWILEVEKRVPGIDFLGRFTVGMADSLQAPPVATVAAPADFGIPARPARESLRQVAPALAVSLALGTAWLGYRDGWLLALQGPSGQWMEQAGFQREMNFWHRHGTYPALIEVRCDGGVALYRADWKSLPPGAFYQAWSVMTPDDFARRDRDYRRSGYVLEMSGRFRTCRGEERISATWLKRR